LAETETVLMLTAMKISGRVSGVNAAAEQYYHQPTVPTSFSLSAGATVTKHHDDNG